MTPDAVREAFRAEAQSLSAAAAREPAAAFARPSPCPPWTVGQLLCHVRIAVGRLSGMLTGPEPDGGALVSAADYYRPDRRFSPAVNSDRIGTAQRAAASLTAGELAADFDRGWQEAWALVLAAPPGRVVATRHGDRMQLTEFLRTRVLELAVHGLDLAAGLGREPWLTGQAAAVVEDLVLPAGSAAGLRRQLGWDQATLIAAVTGRRQPAAAELTLIERQDIRWLALG